VTKPTSHSIALLDGGLGQEIYRRAPDVSSPLWSVAVMLQHPNIVKDVHADFIRAGAKTHTLNTYAATPTRLKNDGMYDKIEQIYQQAFDVLNLAIEEMQADVDIAGCLGPLVGSYRDQPNRTFEEMRDEFAEMVSLQSEVDIFLIETMTNSFEALAACAAAYESGKPYGVSFRLEQNGKLKSGESLADAINVVKEHSPTAILLNCCDPEVVTAAIAEMADLSPCVGGYANAFRSIDTVAQGNLCDTLEAREEITPQFYAQQVKHWINDGARVVGGCCEITPTHIQQLVEDLKADQIKLIRFSELAKAVTTKANQ